MARPCWSVGLALLVGCLIGAWLPTNVLLMAALGSIVVVIMSVAVPLLRRRRALLLSLFGVCAALISLCVVQFGNYIPLSRRVGETLSLTAQVNESDSGVFLTVTSGDLPRGTSLQLWSYADRLAPEPFDVLEGTFTLCEYGEYGLSALQRKASGTWFAVKPLEVKITEGTQPWNSLFSAWRNKAVKRIEAHLSDDTAALVAGVCFGADKELSEQAQNTFRACGISHLFSVSGFHMALLSQALLWLLERFRVSRRVRAVITALLLVLFMALVGTEPSVIRSGVLCLLMLVASCFRRQADTRNSLGLALILLLIADPFAAYDVGLLLSFFATFGLVMLCPWLVVRMKRVIRPAFREKHPYYSKAYDLLTNGVALTVCATLATLPITLLYFGEISVVAVISNLLVSLPSSALLIFGLIGCLCVDLLGLPFFFCAGAIARYLLWIGEKISKFPLVTVAITAPYLLLWITGAVILLIVCYRVARRKGLILAAVTAVVSLLLAMSANTFLMRDVTSVTAVPTNGDAALYVRSGEKTALICAPSHVNTLYRIRTALRLDGVKQVDYLIVPDGDENTLLLTTSFLKEQLADATVLYGAQATCLRDQFERSRPLSQETVLLWEGVTLRVYEQHCHLAMQQTDLLIFTDSGSIRCVPTELWASELVLFGDDVPEDALFLKSRLGVVQGNPYVRPLAAYCGVEQLLFVTDDRLSILTRGAGDITYR